MKELRRLLGEVGKRSFWWYLCYGEWMAWRRAGIRRPKKLITIAFRGFGKSTIGAAVDQWIHLLDPNIAEVVSSYDIDKSKEFVQMTKTVWEGLNQYGLFSDLYGVWAPTGLDNRKWADGLLTHAERPNPTLRDYSIRATSVTKGATGGRPDYFRLDDPIVKEKLKEERTWVFQALEHLDSMKFAQKSNALTLVQLTPYVEGDVAARVMREEGIASWSGCPAPREGFYKEGGPWHVWFQPVRGADGRSVIPQVYPDDYLMELEEGDPDDFASQMMCDPASSKNMPLTDDDVKYLWVEPDHIPRNLQVSVHCDTAFKDPKRAGHGDYNVIQIWGHDRVSGTVYYLDGWRSNTASGSDFMEKLVIMLQELKRRRAWPFVVTDERVGGGKEGLFEQFLVEACHKHGIPSPNLLLVRRSTSKEDRILQAVYGWKTGKVRLVRGAGAVQELVYEMTHIGFAKRDMADAGADVFHPDVYTPPPTTGGDQPVDRGRPYDELMWTPPGEWRDVDIRTIYDELDERPQWDGSVH